MTYVGPGTPTGTSSSSCSRYSQSRGCDMASFDTDRRLLLSVLMLVPLGEIVRAGPALAQTGSALPPIVQPAEKTKAGFLERARALRDQAVKEGDQAYGA